MRIPAPDRLDTKFVVNLAIVIFVGQLLEGTNFFFAVLTAVYILLWAWAFNVAGGIRYPSGAFIFFNGFLNVVVGLGFKILLGQPGDRNLVAPISTMVVYCIGMIAMLCAAFLTRSLRPARGLLGPLDNLEEYKQAAIVCLVAGAVVYLVDLVGGNNPLFSIFRQINKLPQLSIMLATTYEIVRSDGKRSFNWVVTVGLFVLFLEGLFSFGKEGMLLGFTAYVLAAALSGYNFPKMQIATSVVMFAFFSYYLVPYSQYARGFKATSVVGDVAVAVQYLGNLKETRQLYESTLEDFDISFEPHLYDKREGFLDRLIILPADDAIINYTNQGNVFGLSPTYTSYANFVPRFIWHNKPSTNSGNAFAHELQLLPDDDETTGVAFSASGDAYHQAKWLGLLVLLPVTIFLYCIICDTIVGSARWAPWALVPILDLSEIGPDGGLGGLIYYFSYGMFAMVVVYLLIKKVAPFIVRSLGARRIGAVEMPAMVAVGSLESTLRPNFHGGKSD